MTVVKEAREESYDAVVVGAGMGGLAVGSLLGRAGRRVLVVERHDRPGGLAHGFQRGKYRFDSSVHVTSGCEPVAFGEGALIHDLLTLLGVRDRCTFLPINPFYEAVFPGFRLAPPTGVEEFIQAHLKHFPGEEKGLRKLIRLQVRINREAKQMPSDLSSYDSLNLPEEYPFHYKYREATLAQVMDEHLTDPRLKAVLAGLWGYQGLPPSRLAFVKWAPMLMAFLGTGVFYCKGGFQNLANAFAEGLKKFGGELLLQSTVRRITVQDGKATGVVLENGQRIQAPVVVSNSSARHTFEEMVGTEHLPASFTAMLRTLKPSLSAVLVYMATDLDLARMGAEHEMCIFTSWDHDQIFEDLLQGKPAAVLVSIPSLADPSVAPPGEHLLTAVTLLPYELAGSWRKEKDRFAQGVVDVVETVFPGFKDHITFMEKASPRTVERYTLNYEGAIYGWEQSPQQSGANRLTRVTPVKGLYLAGHWTHPGGGVISVVCSGMMTAQVILGYPSVLDLLKGLGLEMPAPPGP